MMPPPLARAVLAEALGTALLLAAVVGSGIMAQRLAAGNDAIALLANTLATVWALVVLIELFGPVSGAHFNPVVSWALVLRHQLEPARAVAYTLAQLAGAVAGAALANAMFELPLLHLATTVRTGPGQWLAEAVATFGLLLVVLRAPPAKASWLVASWIGAAYWFTASTSFANPAAAFGRMFSDSFAGIDPSSVPAFVAAQGLGGLLALLAHRLLAKPQA